MHIFNLLLYNLLQANIKNVAIFHCWRTKTIQPLAQMFANELFYAQYINLAQADALDRFEYRYFSSQLPRLGVFLDMSCDSAEELLNMTSRERLYTHRFHWLLYDQSANLTNLEELFAHANLSINADITYIMPNDNNSIDSTNFVLYDVYNKGSHIGGKLNITIDQEIQCNVSACTTVRYLSELHKRTRLQQRSDLSDVTFRISTLITTLPLNAPQQDLLDFLSSNKDSHIDWLPRLGFHLLKVMQDILRFNTTHIWQYTWSERDYIGGVIDDLVNENAEVATTPFVLSPARLRYIVGLTEISGFRSICIFRTPHNAGIKTGVFLEPFTANVWLVFAALLLIGAVLLWLTFRMEHQCMRRYLSFMPSLLTTCLISFGAACIQGVNLQPHTTGGRIVFFVLLLTSFLMYNYYTSIVVSTLLGSPVGSNIKTVQQLADSSLDVGFEPIPFTHAYLNASPRTDIQNLKKNKIATKKNPESVWLPAKDGILRVRDEPGFVYISETSFIYYYIERYYRPHEICELNEISFRPESSVYSLMHKNSTYRELYKQHEIRLHETGIEWKHRNFWSRKKLHCYTSNYVITVGMEYAAPLFIMLLIAYIIVLIVLAIEIAVKSYMQHNAMSFENLFGSYLQHKLPKLGIFLDMNCNQTAQILALANEARTYTEHYHWLLYDNEASLYDLNTTFDGATFSNDADITYSVPKARSDKEFSYITFDVYNKGPELGGVLNITIDKEIICNNSGCHLLRHLSELHKRSRLDQRRNLAGLTMRVATVITSRSTTLPESELLNFLHSQEDTKIDPYPRMGFQMRMLLKDMLNCNFSYIFSDRWSTDEFIGGIIGEIFNGTAELTSSPLMLTPQRVPYLRALTEVTSFRSICVFLTPRHAEVKAATFLAPFTYPVWCIYVSLLLLTGAVLWLTFRCEHWHMKFNIDFVPSLLTTCVISFGAACIQGSQLLPRSIGGRMTLFALMLTTFLIYNYYTSIVVSSLLGKPAQSNIKTIQQLADSPLEVAVQPVQYTRTYVEISTRSDIRSLYKKKVASKKDAAWLDTEEGVLRVRDSPGFVYITDAATAYEYAHKHYMPHQICGLNEIPLRPEAAIYMLVNRNMSYKELIKLNELRIMETGILRKHRDFWIRTKLHCYNSNELVNVHMSDIAPLIILLVCGYGLSILALIGEILWQQQCVRRLKLQSCH